MKAVQSQYPQNRDGMWQYMCTHPTFYIKEIAHHVNVHSSSVIVYVKALHRAGYLKASSKSRDPLMVSYTLSKTPCNLRPELTAKGLPVPPSAPQRMWKAMKVIKRFTLKDLCLTASVHNLAALRYCEFLYEAGYLRILSGLEKKSLTVFAFNSSKDTGHYAPQVRNSRHVYDRNLNQIVWTEMFKEAV